MLILLLILLFALLTFFFCWIYFLWPVSFLILERQGRLPVLSQLKENQSPFSAYRWPSSTPSCSEWPIVCFCLRRFDKERSITCFSRGSKESLLWETRRISSPAGRTLAAPVAGASGPLWLAQPRAVSVPYPPAQACPQLVWRNKMRHD